MILSAKAKLAVNAEEIAFAMCDDPSVSIIRKSSTEFYL